MGCYGYKIAAQIIYESGYATNPKYPEKLIRVIEEYKLYQYDKKGNDLFKLYLDPGHGGTDPGAVANGLREKDLTLTISKKIRDILASEYEGVTVKMSRTDDTFPSLKQRTNEANAWGANSLLSIHINPGGGTGFETFTYSGTTQKYQSFIHDEIMKGIGLKDRGKKQGNFHVLRESNMPAVLTKCGFIDSSNDSKKMKECMDRKCVLAHVTGLAKRLI